MLTHVVFFKLSPEAKDRAGELVARLSEMKASIPELAEIGAGVDVSRSERSWDAALYTRFRSEADLETYRSHPAHQNVLELIREVCSETSVGDYESQG